MKKIIFFISLFIIIFFLGKNLLPTNNYFFTFHDKTQPARIQQFVKEIKNFHIPPRVAPDMNYGLGYPIFNFYAPTSYWITSFFHLVGFDIISSIKISFLLALVFGFWGSYKFLKIFFDFIPAIFGGFLYITSLYFPLNIFVRGNLAEVWFLALFPLSLFFVYQNSQKDDKKIFIFSSFINALLLTSHNLLSLVALPIIFLFILLLKNKTKNLLNLAIAVLLTAYFWLPLFIELKHTWAYKIASSTNFRDHFLCPSQLWQSNWGYGGSVAGCDNDGMSFMIGKIQLVLFGAGVIVFLFLFKKKAKKTNSISYFFLFLNIFSLFLTTYQSKLIWEIFSPFLSIIQFPWRFISFSLLGIVYFSVFFLNTIKIPLKNFFILTLLIITITVNGKYFKGQQISKKTFEEKFLSQEYIEKKAAYAAAEYLPKTIDYYYWRNLEKKNNIPKEFYLKYSIAPFRKDKQTTIEIIANIISLLGFFILLWTTLRKKQSFQR